MDASSTRRSCARIEGLVIPPAWPDVWISPSPSADLQATGLDAAGRRQCLYRACLPGRPGAGEVRPARAVRRALPDLRKTTARHVRREPSSPSGRSRTRRRSINRAWFRVGSERYARTSRTYGVTTLLKRHVSVQGRTLRFTFRAKHRTLVRITLVDPDLAVRRAELLALPGGSRLFRFQDDGAYRDLTGQLLNEYLAEHLGGGFTAKDFRTWGGSLTAAIALAEHGPAASETEARRAIAAAMRRVGEQLGNTPRGRARLLRQPGRDRAVPRGANARELPSRGGAGAVGVGTGLDRGGAEPARAAPLVAGASLRGRTATRVSSGEARSRRRPRGPRRS